MKKMMMCAVILMIIILSSSILVHGQNGEGEGPLEADTDVSDLDDGKYDCSNGCKTQEGNVYTGEIEKEGSLIKLNSGTATVGNAGVTAPAAVEGSKVTLTGEGSRYAKGEMTVTGTAVCEQACAVGKADVNGFNVNDANGVTYEGSHLKGTAGSACNVDGLSFAAGDKIDMSKEMDAKGAKEITTINEGNAKATPDFKGSLKVKEGSAATAEMPNGAVLVKGSVNIGPNGEIDVGPNSAIEYDADGAGGRESQFSSDKGFRFSVNGECKAGNCVDVSTADGKRTLSISNTGEPASAITASFNAVDKVDKNGEMDGKITPGEGPYSRLSVNLDKDNAPISIREDDCGDQNCLQRLGSSRIIFTYDTIDSIGTAGMPPSLDNVEVTAGDESRIFQNKDGVWECSSCTPSETAPASTHFFSFVGKAWGWVTGRVPEQTCADVGKLNTKGIKDVSNVWPAKKQFCYNEMIDGTTLSKLYGEVTRDSTITTNCVNIKEWTTFKNFCDTNKRNNEITEKCNKVIGLKGIVWRDDIAYYDNLRFNKCFGMTCGREVCGWKGLEGGEVGCIKAKSTGTARPSPTPPEEDEEVGTPGFEGTVTKDECGWLFGDCMIHEMHYPITTGTGTTIEGEVYRWDGTFPDTYYLVYKSEDGMRMQKCRGRPDLTKGMQCGEDTINSISCETEKIEIPKCSKCWNYIYKDKNC